MKRIFIFTILFFALTSINSCLFLLLDSTNGLTVDPKDDTTLPVLHLTIDGVEKKYAVFGIKRAGEYYMLEVQISSNWETAGDKDFNIYFSNPEANKSYGYDSSVMIEILASPGSEESGSFNYTKVNPEDVFEVDITRFDSKASFSFNAVLQPANYDTESVPEDMVRQRTVSGYIENAGFLEDGNSRSVNVIVDGNEEKWYITSANGDNYGIQKSTSSFNLEISDNPYDNNNANSLSINFPVDTTVGEYTDPSNFSARFSNTVNSNSTAWSSDINGSSTRYQISKLDTKASLTFTGTLKYDSNNSNTDEQPSEQSRTVSFSVSDVAVVDVSGGDGGGQEYDPIPVTLTINGTVRNDLYILDGGFSRDKNGYKLEIRDSMDWDSADERISLFVANYAQQGNSYTNTSDVSIWYYQGNADRWGSVRDLSNYTVTVNYLTQTLLTVAVNSSIPYDVLNPDGDPNGKPNAAISGQLVNIPIIDNTNADMNTNPVITFKVDGITYTTPLMEVYQNGSDSYYVIYDRSGGLSRSISINMKPGTTVGSYDQNSSQITAGYSEVVDNTSNYTYWNIYSPTFIYTLNANITRWDTKASFSVTANLDNGSSTRNIEVSMSDINFGSNFW
jgi:hypothetical protein